MEPQKGLVTVDVDDKKFQTIQKYVLVFILVVQSWVITVMAKKYDTLQTEWRTSTFDLLLKHNINIQDNTNTLKENSSLIRELINKQVNPKN